MQSFPYKKTYEGLFLAVKSGYVVLENYLPELHLYENYDTYPRIQINGKYHNAHINSVELSLIISLNGTGSLKPTLVFIFKIDVDGVSQLKPSFINVRVAQYCFEIMKQHIIEEPVCDKNGALFPIPNFGYGESHFENDRYEL